jgi:hypothetical protein
MEAMQGKRVLVIGAGTGIGSGIICWMRTAPTRGKLFPEHPEMTLSGTKSLATRGRLGDISPERNKPNSLGRISTCQLRPHSWGAIANSPSWR